MSDGSRVFCHGGDPTVGSPEQRLVGDAVEGVQLEEVLRDRQAEDAAHGEQGAQVRVVPVQ